MENVDKPLISKDTPPVLGIYAKQPVPGQVKTRLSPPLSPEQSASLYQVSLQETVCRMQALQGIDQVICFAGEQDWFSETFPGIPLMPQMGAGLSARLSDSLIRLWSRGYRRVVMIGSDSPDLPYPLVEQAFELLLGNDLVLAPASDGGYVLVGLSTCQPALFEKIPWSTGRVFDETLAKAAALKLRVAELPGWEDLDDLAALKRLLQRSPECRTAGFLRDRMQALLNTG